MADYYFPLKNRFAVAEETDAFVFNRSGSDFTFNAGQSIDMTLENPMYTDAKGDVRPFSISSSPNEKGTITIATRMDSPQRPISAFKKTLREMPLGTKVKFAGPFGNFNLHENIAKKAVFLAGGIGITPIRSIIKYASEEKLPHKISLIYSNRNEKSTPFLEEIKKWESQNQNFRLFMKMTEDSGYIDGKYVLEALNNDIGNAIYYIVGPAAMVQALTKILEELSVSKDDMRFEEFSGY